MRNALVCVTIALMALTLGVSNADAAACRGCELAWEQCAVGCAGLDAKASERVACLIGCDNEAAACSCDGPVSLRSEDLVDDGAIKEAAASACHSTTPCGTAYPSCASWSGYFNCGSTFCGVAPFCGDDCEPCEPWPPLPLAGPETELICRCPGPALKQYQERYRVCFNAQAQSCTEYQRIVTTVGCGCGF